MTNLQAIAKVEERMASIIKNESLTHIFAVIMVSQMNEGKTWSQAFDVASKAVGVILNI